ncbi:hypothetical protein QBC36DRAFT_315686 [Triangularia setosa]|uniref:Uncharacterized protein n=1 Tax=Triangularia setosa TaxID=2587417 RepID=A0AAN6W0M1_9PEZI|nr:hypothetical protein QBC36DRAFT_315686 [Podospora setosa]
MNNTKLISSNAPNMTFSHQGRVIPKSCSPASNMNQIGAAFNNQSSACYMNHLCARPSNQHAIGPMNHLGELSGNQYAINHSNQIGVASNNQSAVLNDLRAVFGDLPIDSPLNGLGTRSDHHSTPGTSFNNEYISGASFNHHSTSSTINGLGATIGTNSAASPSNHLAAPIDDQSIANPVGHLPAPVNNTSLPVLVTISARLSFTWHSRSRTCRIGGTSCCSKILITGISYTLAVRRTPRHN